MEHVNRNGGVVLITEHGEGKLSAAIEGASSLDVRLVSLDRAVDVVGNSLAESTNADATIDTATAGKPSGVVLELDQPSAIRSVVARVKADLPGVPTIVVPQEGSERAAAAALRAGANEYVPTDEAERAADRIVEAVAAAPSGSTTEASAEYHRILANELPDEAFVISEDGTYLEAKIRPGSASLYTVSAEELVGNRIQDAFPDDVAARLLSCLERAIETSDVQSVEYGADTTEGRRRFEARVVPIEERIEGRRAVVWLARDITERAKRERQLQLRQDRLETLNRINQVVRQVIETLVEAPTQGTIERKVCDQLVESELYCASWIAERIGEGQLSYRTGAGKAETVLETVESRSFEGAHPARCAVERGEIRTVNDVHESELIPDELQDAAREDNVDAAIAVPISHGDTIYGVLCVLASRNDAFTESEQNGFQLLGETIGFTISAVKNRQLLFSDSVLELEFRIDNGETFSFDLSTKYDCTCSLEWAGSTVDGRIFQYVTVEGIDGETVLEEASTHDSVEECRLIHDGTDQCTIEIRLTESGVRTLANHGATIRDVTVEDGVGHLLVEVPRDADVREIAEALKFVYEDTELEARREVDHPVRTAVERRKRVLDQLTERQLTTLRLAYYGGFFDWPRESTGEDIAEAMDVSPPTMHQHLRKGMKTVLGEFFEESSGTM
ncbi:bacterio-opsin activator domain-containing protein [Natronococcus wangiae]|uniref:bacterio-opsin activator domain-containing protein n=1 Tax=Natronococcus wangiae TaxID=3068275 RepID=UPI00273E70CC|nr:bacterio-opsin activator domain-containing protein [Natronococcus sp. AD5]